MIGTLVVLDGRRGGFVVQLRVPIMSLPCPCLWIFTAEPCVEVLVIPAMEEPMKSHFFLLY